MLKGNTKGLVGSLVADVVASVRTEPVGHVRENRKPVSLSGALITSNAPAEGDAAATAAAADWGQNAAVSVTEGAPEQVGLSAHLRAAACRSGL